LIFRLIKFYFFFFSFILVPHVWNLTIIDPLLIEYFTQNLTDIVLSGYPTENDYDGMKFILDILKCGHIKNIIFKFPSYCLMNILLPLLIYPRSYSLSYLSLINENNFKQQSNRFLEKFFLPIRKRKLCLQVQIHSIEEKKNLNRVLSTNHYLNEEEDDNSSNDTTHAVISDYINNSDHSFDVFSNPTDSHVHIHSSTLEMRNDFSHVPSENLFQTDLRTIESSHLISLSDNNRFIT